MPAVFATGRCGRHATRQNPSPRRPTEARVQLLLCPTAILADARLTPTELARPGHRHSHHAVIRWAIPMGPCVNRAGGGRASVPHCGCRLPAVILIGFSHPKASYFLVATRKYPKKRPPESAVAHPAAALAHELASVVTPKGHPCPCGGRGGSFPRPLRARSSSALGTRLDQGGQKKQSNSLPLNGGGLGRGCSAR